MGAARDHGPAGKIKACSKLVRDGFVLDEAILARQLNGLFVQAHGVGVTPFEARDLGRYERMLVAESRWIALGPLAQLRLVRREAVAPAIPLVGRSVLIEPRHGQRGVVVIVEQREMGGRGP